MKNLSSLFLLLCSMLSFTACSSDDEDDNAAAHLVNKKWQLAEAKVTSPLPIDFYEDLTACEKDNTLEFKDNNILLLDEGPSKCNPDDAQQEQGAWSISGTTLTLSGVDLGLPISEIKLTVTESSATTLKGTFQETYQGTPVKGKVA
ncbi:lipocalin family protein [Rufibacter ruber]|uniref:lipocalin family protein n=1 Tax=Rufibacter ruber TaxID=1783499 RepID=UPI000AD039A3|nr:lipocalin family protein [Rufibacter ruber]